MKGGLAASAYNQLLGVLIPSPPSCCQGAAPLLAGRRLEDNCLQKVRQRDSGLETCTVESRATKLKTGELSKRLYTLNVKTTLLSSPTHSQDTGSPVNNPQSCRMEKTSLGHLASSRERARSSSERITIL